MKNALARLRELERQLEEHKRKASEVVEKSRKLLSEREFNLPPADTRDRAPGLPKRARTRTRTRTRTTKPSR
jgi:hypothetical protein